MSRLILIIVIIFSIFNHLLAQNLVPNPGFERVNEITDRWMGTFSKFNRAMVLWNSPTQGSPDLLFTGIKDRMRPSRHGFDLTPYEPKSGKLMLGIKTYGCAGQVMHCKEYVQIRLKAPLEIGAEYYFDFYVNPLYTSILTNNLGIAFSTTYTRQLFSEGLYEFEPKINVKEILEYTGEWHKVSGTFVADSAYQYLMIGNFFEDTQTLVDSSDATIDYGFVFIDDVRFVRSDQKHMTFIEEIELDRIQFEWDKSVLMADAYPILEELITLMKEEKPLKIKIIGHTDASGSPEYNLKLSMRRARRVYDYLIENGIAASRLDYTGKGEARPIDSNYTETGRHQNRRVIFEVMN